MHPTPRHFIAENLPVILLTAAVLWILLKRWFTPAINGPVLCPVCRGAGTVKRVNGDSKRLEDVNCGHCYAVGKVGSFKSHTQRVKITCSRCNGLARIIEHIGPVYPDGTPFPNTRSRALPCPKEGCKGGFETQTKTVHGKIVPLTDEQLEAELAMAEALVAAEQGAKG